MTVKLTLKVASIATSKYLKQISPSETISTCNSCFSVYIFFGRRETLVLLIILFLAIKVVTLQLPGHNVFIELTLGCHVPSGLRSVNMLCPGNCMVTGIDYIVCLFLLFG
jgi:hypothetical protein